MKKILAVLLAALMLLSGMSVFAEEEKVLNIFTWESYVDEVTLGQFMDETGIQVNYQTFAYCGGWVNFYAGFVSASLRNKTS